MHEHRGDRHPARPGPGAHHRGGRAPSGTLVLGHGAGGGVGVRRPGRGDRRGGRGRLARGPGRAAVAGRRQADRARTAAAGRGLAGVLDRLRDDGRLDRAAGARRPERRRPGGLPDGGRAGRGRRAGAGVPAASARPAGEDAAPPSSPRVGVPIVVRPGRDRRLRRPEEVAAVLAGRRTRRSTPCPATTPSRRTSTSSPRPRCPGSPSCVPRLSRGVVEAAVRARRHGALAPRRRRRRTTSTTSSTAAATPAAGAASGPRGAAGDLEQVDRLRLRDRLGRGAPRAAPATARCGPVRRWPGGSAGRWFRSAGRWAPWAPGRLLAAGAVLAAGAAFGGGHRLGHRRGLRRRGLRRRLLRGRGLRRRLDLLRSSDALSVAAAAAFFVAAAAFYGRVRRRRPRQPAPPRPRSPRPRRRRCAATAAPVSGALASPGRRARPAGRRACRRTGRAACCRRRS